jgi:hypothetical protein
MRAGRLVWGAVIFLAAIGSAVALRRMVHLVPVVIGGYRAPVVAANPALAQLTALDDLFARSAILTLVHIVPGLLFMVLGPWQFSATIRARHLRWHQWNGRIFVFSGVVIGVGAGDEFCDAGDRRSESGGGDHVIWGVLSDRAGQGGLAYPEKGSGAASRVDDSRVCRGVGGGNDTADHRNIFCDQPDYGFDTA